MRASEADTLGGSEMRPLRLYLYQASSMDVCIDAWFLTQGVSSLHPYDGSSIMTPYLCLICLAALLLLS